MRKTVKIRPYARDTISQESDEYQNSQPPVLENITNMDNIQSDNETRTNRVNELINQMSNVSAENDGQGLADFRPPPMPQMNTKKSANPDDSTYDPISLPQNSLQIPVPMIPKNSSANPYLSNRSNLVNYGSYQTAYEPTNITPKPYYSRMGLGNGGGELSQSESSRVLEKINYMIHLLENQENEKTANVTEEFILYTFLGIFMIYVVDSFSRGGKYVR